MQDSEKQWELKLWENENGFCPVAEFFDDLSKRKKVEFRRMLKKLDWLTKHPLSKLEIREDLGKVKNEDFWELRFNVGIEIRILGIKQNNELLEIFLAVHGFHKKDQKLRKSDIEKARERLKTIL